MSIYLIVTSSSADVGWMATVSSKSFFVAPILTATANPCSISSAPSPTIWTPTTWTSKQTSYDLFYDILLYTIFVNITIIFTSVTSDYYHYYMSADPVKTFYWLWPVLPSCCLYVLGIHTGVFVDISNYQLETNDITDNKLKAELYSINNVLMFCFWFRKSNSVRKMYQ